MSETRFAGLAARLDLKPDELKRAFGLGLMLAGIIASYTLAKTVRDAHFLSVLPVLMLLMSAVMKFVKPPQVVEGFKPSPV